jgi:Vitamin K-dependent gamma-carboxylase
VSERLRRVARAWVALTSEQEPPRVLALLRMAVGLVLLGSLFSAYASGVLESMWIDKRYGGALELERTTFWVEVLGGPSRSVIFGLFAAASLSGALVVLGLGGRVPYLVAAQAYDSLVRMNGDTVGSYDSMLTNALYLLFFSAANATLSVDCRLRSGSWISERPRPAWPRYLLIFQLLVVYGATGLQKLSLTWTPLGGYSALYWVFQDPTWRRFDLSFTAFAYPLLVLGTAVTWHFEIGAPLLLLHYRALRQKANAGRVHRWLVRWDLRKPFVLVGVCLHVGVLLLLNVGPFSLISLAYYLAFLRPQELERPWSWLRTRLGAGPS